METEAMTKGAGKSPETLRDLILKGLERKSMERQDLAHALGLDTPVSVSKWIRPDRQDPVPWRHWRRIAKTLNIPWKTWYRVAKTELPASAKFFERTFKR